METRTPPQVTTLVLEDVCEAALRVVVSPVGTLLLLAASSIGDGADVPAWLRRRILRRLRRQDVEALLPMRPGAAAEVPDYAFGTLEPGVHRLRDELERIAQASDADFAAQLGRLAAGGKPDVWSAPVLDPERWTRAYVRALARAWPAVAPVWSAAAPRLRREVERIGLASAIGAQPELLAGVWPRSRVTHDGFSFAVGNARWPEQIGMRDGALILTPMLSRRRRRLIGFANDRPRQEVRDLAYAVPLPGGEPPAAGASSPPLDALLGTPRATILRALVTASDMTSLADALQAVPSSATRHVAALAAAGLVEQRRCGRRVVVHLSVRGAALLDLYRR